MVNCPKLQIDFFILFPEYGYKKKGVCREEKKLKKYFFLYFFFRFYSLDFQEKK